MNRLCCSGSSGFGAGFLLMSRPYQAALQFSKRHFVNSVKLPDQDTSGPAHSYGAGGVLLMMLVAYSS